MHVSEVMTAPVYTIGEDEAAKRWHRPVCRPRIHEVLTLSLFNFSPGLNCADLDVQRSRASEVHIHTARASRLLVDIVPLSGL